MSIVDCSNGEGYVPAKDDGGQPDRQVSRIRKGCRQCDHERFVGHGINDAPDHALQIPAPSDPAIEQVCNAGVPKENYGWVVLAMDDEIAYGGCRKKSAKSKKIRQCVDILVGGRAPGEFLLEDAMQFGRRIRRCLPQIRWLC